MTKLPNPKGQRALELLEKGIPRPVIAERLGISPANISDLIRNARKQRERQQEQE
jgi:predicted transcriptional regulator